MKEEVEQVKETITKYMEIHYKMLGNQHYNPYLYKDYFAYNLKGNYSFIQEEVALKNEIACYAQVGSHLMFDDPEVDVKWRMIHNIGKQCQVHVGVDLKIKYKGIDTLTIMKNLEHFFVLVKEGSVWRIEEDRYLSEFKAPINSEKDKVKGVKRKTKRRKRWILASREEKVQPKGQYMREKAVAYAKKYALTPNTQEWKNYEEYGGDCTNFISQCLFAGEIPFDHQGKYVSEKWYWYSDYYRTPSFTSASALKDYMISNTGFGLVAKLGTLESLQIGDIVQLGDLEKTTHSMIVIQIIKDENDSSLTKEVLVAQHSVEGGIRGYNIPLSSKPKTRLYYNILGYNS
ncbi:MAG: amidase domain-containing protein [Niameybacter sp.]